MATTDRKVKKLMREYAKTNNLTKAALRADMDRKTARKYVKAGELPSQMNKQHDWRTREDPFKEDRAELERKIDFIDGKIESISFRLASADMSDCSELTAEELADRIEQILRGE